MSILTQAENAVLAGERISREQAEALFAEADLHTLGALAHHVRMAKHPDPVVTYVVDRNINYSNVCVCGCKFCAYYRSPDQEGGFLISREELGQKLRETLDLGGTQILMQGGHHPDLPLSYYEDMLAWIKAEFPIHIHAFSPPEIMFWSEKEGLEPAEVIRRLRAAGLDSIPGGGAEILDDEVRSRIAPNKCSTANWLRVMEEAHKQGLRTTATMMFGHVEEPRHILNHLFGLRELQDRTHGFTAFIPWTFQPRNTVLGDKEGVAGRTTAVQYLRVLALARVVLDNFDNIQVSWVTMGPKIAQLALYFGGNDFGSTMIEENVVKAAGVSFRLSEEEISRLVEGAGFTPRRRLMDYTLREREEAK